MEILSLLNFNGKIMVILLNFIDQTFSIGYNYLYVLQGGYMGSVVKKRRKKMRKHKYKKMRRKNRHKKK